MRRLETLLIALALFGATPVAAQEDVYDYESLGSSDDEVSGGSRGSRGSRVRVSGAGRDRLIPELYTVRRGDTLWDVTGRYYGNPWEWPRVWSYNPEITNPHWIYPLDQLRLLATGAQPLVPGAPISVIRHAPRMPAGTVFLRQEGYIDREALSQAGVIVGSPDDHMLLAPYDNVYIEFEEGLRTAPRGEYTIFREMPSSDREAQEEGSLVRIYGAVRIDSYDPERHTARATIIEALDPIERGFRVAPIPRQFDIVPPRVADRDLESRVVATLRPRQLLGEQQVVFLPVGSEDGVRAGNRFFVIRAGDTWRDNLPAEPENAGASEAAPTPQEQYPPEILAEGRVVHVRPHSSTLIITRSVREVRLGDRVHMQQGY